MIIEDVQHERGNHPNHWSYVAFRVTAGLVWFSCIILTFVSIYRCIRFKRREMILPVVFAAIPTLMLPVIVNIRW